MAKEQYIIEHSLDTAHSILYARPTSAFEQGDFAELAKTVDAHIAQRTLIWERWRKGETLHQIARLFDQSRDPPQ